MEIRHLRYFLAVAQELNVSRAAKRLGIAQPSLSRQIADLERELGLRLFERSAVGMALTDLGRTFRNQTAKIVDALDAAVAETKRTVTESASHFRIGTDWNKPFLPVAEAAIVLRKKYPKLTVDLVELPGSQHLAALRDGSIDLGFISKFVPGSRAGMESVPIFSGEFRVVLPTNHPSAGKTRLRVRDLKGERWLVPAGFPDYKALLARIFRPNRFVPKFGRSARYISGMLAAVENGEGVALLPAAVLPPPRASVRYVPADVGLLEVHATWCRTNPRSYLREYLGLLREAIDAPRKTAPSPGPIVQPPGGNEVAS